jgi:hypothetical protein
MTYNKQIEKLKYQIQNLSTWLWGHRVLDKDIDDWLKNFDTTLNNQNKERFIALSILSQFMFYDQREIRQALKSLYKDKYIAPLVKKYRNDTASLELNEYEKYLEESLQKTRFSSIGNPSESSSIVLYFFRQRNKIPKNLFIHSCEILMDEQYNNLEQLVYIDDISGSGSQATNKSIRNIIDKIREKIPDIKISYFTLFATTEALGVLKESNLFDSIDTVFELDETYKVFSETSRYFRINSSCKEYFSEICKTKYLNKFELGMEDISKNADGTYNNKECGFANGQLALGLFYNIPNNTLPIFWANSNQWQSIFKRYSKKYTLFKKGAI